MNREKVIIRTSIIGILANIGLVIFKSIVGALSGSIAIVLDAVNNLSDALSSVITIIGTKIASKKPDKEHPMGHGRFEYITGMAIAVIIIIAGWQSFVDSIEKIFDPGEAPTYSTVTLIIIIGGILVKIILGSYVLKTGRKVDSSALIGSGKDALFDAIISTSVLVSALLYVFFSIRIEAYIGFFIAIFILKSGIEMLLESKDDIIGKRSDDEEKAEILSIILEDKRISGAYDLFLHNYGPNKIYGSVHVEIPDVMTASQIDALERDIFQRVYDKTGIILTAVGIYSVNTTSEHIREVESTVNRIIHSHEGVIQTHGFYLNEDTKTVSIDIILDFAVTDRPALIGKIQSELESEYREYRFLITDDLDL